MSFSGLVFLNLAVDLVRVTLDITSGIGEVGRF